VVYRHLCTSVHVFFLSVRLCNYEMWFVDRLYSCLANGSADEFQKGEQLFKSKSVSNALQIGKYVNVTLILCILLYIHKFLFAIRH